MDFTGGDSSDVYMSIEELSEEITFQKIILRSIDDATLDREQAEANVKAEIRGLESRVRALKQNRSGKHAPAPGHATSVVNKNGSMEDPFGDDPFQDSRRR